MTAPDLTAQLAASVRAAWEERHNVVCLFDGCSGRNTDCPSPKPSALVAYEQGQAELGTAVSSDYHKNLRDAARANYEQAQRVEQVRRQGIIDRARTEIARRLAQRHGDELPLPNCAYATCHDLRADGAGELPEPNEALKAALRRDLKAYVLFSQPGPRDTGDTEILRVYASESAAEAACALCLEVDKIRSYRVHAVARVE